MDDGGRRSRDASPKPGARGYVPKMDIDTVRPPGAAGEDAYSSETVVRAVPAELLREYKQALKPAGLPQIGGAPPSSPEPSPPATDDREIAPSTPQPPSIEQPASIDQATPSVGYRDGPLDLDDDEGDPPPLSAHAAVSTRLPGEELADDPPPFEGSGEEPAAGRTQEKPGQESLSFWIGLGLIAAVAVGLLISQCE
jgi:hypothetical protein